MAKRKAPEPATPSADPLADLLAGRPVPIADACAALTAAGLRIVDVDSSRPGRVALITIAPKDDHEH